MPLPGIAAAGIKAAPYILQGLSALGGVFGKKKKYMDAETLRQLYGPRAIGKDTQELSNYILNSPYGQQLMASAAEQGQGLQTDMAARAAASGLSPDTGASSGASDFQVSAATQAQTVHQIAYANSAVVPSTGNPSFPFYASTLNGVAGVTSTTIKCGSFAIFTLGSTGAIPALRGATSQSVLNFTTEAAVITLKNKATDVLGGTNTNRTPIQLDWISISTAGSKPVVIRALHNTTLGGTPSYTDIDTNTSIAQKDVAGTTITGGHEHWSAACSGAGQLHVDVTDLRIMVMPGETLTFSGQSAANADISIRVGWHEHQ